MECGIIEPQSQYISPRLICIDTGKDQKMQRKQFHLEFLNFFIIFIGHGWTNRIWHTSGKLCVKYTNVSTSDKKIRPVYCNTLTNIYMGLQMKDKKIWFLLEVVSHTRAHHNPSIVKFGVSLAKYDSPNWLFVRLQKVPTHFKSDCYI